MHIYILSLVCRCSRIPVSPAGGTWAAGPRGTAVAGTPTPRTSVPMVGALYTRVAGRRDCPQGWSPPVVAWGVVNGPPLSLISHPNEDACAPAACLD